MKVECELGERHYSEKFSDKEMASAFIHAIIKNEALRWTGPTEATAKGGVLIVRAKELEDLVEMKPTAKLADEVSAKINAFLNGHWPDGKTEKKKATGKPTGAKAASSGKAGLVTLAEICSRNKWSPRSIRMKLRSDKSIKKPAGGSWAWPSAEAAKVEKKLKELMKA